MYSTLDVRITVVAFGASERANVHATKFASSRDVQAMNEIGLPRAGLRERPPARAVRLDRADVVAVGERRQPRGLHVDDGDVVLVVECRHDRRAHLPRADDEDLHAAAEGTPIDRVAARLRSATLT